jgi:hypothetical protein
MQQLPTYTVTIGTFANVFENAVAAISRQNGLAVFANQVRVKMDVFQSANDANNGYPVIGTQQFTFPWSPVLGNATITLLTEACPDAANFFANSITI